MLIFHIFQEWCWNSFGPFKTSSIDNNDAENEMDVNCLHEEHTADRDLHVLDVMCDIMEASRQCIPLYAKARPPGKSKREILPAALTYIQTHRKNLTDA